MTAKNAHNGTAVSLCLCIDACRHLQEMTLKARRHPNASYHVIQNKCSTFVDCARVLHTTIGIMMSYQKARYALWHHPSMHMNKSLEWRETPKSKHLIAVVPPTVLPGLVEVVEVHAEGFKVQLMKTIKQNVLNSG